MSPRLDRRHVALAALALILAQLVEQALLFALMPPASYGPDSGTEVTDMLDVAAHPFPAQPPALGAVLRYRRYLMPALAAMLPTPARPWFFLTAATIATAVAFVALVVAFRALVSPRQALAGALLLVTLPSLWASVRHGMPDELLLALLVLAWLAVRHERYIMGAVLYGLACLTKETAAIVVVGEAVVLLVAGRRCPSAIVALGAALFPLALWAALALRWGAPLWYLNVIPGVAADRFENMSLFGPLNIFDSSLTRGNAAVIAANILLVGLAVALIWRARRLPPIWWLGSGVTVALLLWSDPVIYQGYLDREIFLLAWPLWIVVCRWCATPQRFIALLAAEALLGFEQALEQARYFVVHKELRNLLVPLLDAARGHVLLISLAVVVFGGLFSAHLVRRTKQAPSSPPYAADG